MPEFINQGHPFSCRAKVKTNILLMFVFLALFYQKTPPSKESDVTTLKQCPHSVLHHYRLHKTTRCGHQL